MDKVTSGDQIKGVVPHRYENILVDRTAVSAGDAGQKGLLFLKIDRPDSLGREIFLKQKRPGEWVVLATVIMEILALGSIVCSERLQPGGLVFFAGISQFEKWDDLPAGQEMNGLVEKKKDKGGFLLCSGEISVGDRPVAKGQMMAFFVGSTPEGAAAAKKPIEVDLTHHFEMVLPRDPQLKSPDMYVVDALVADDLDQGRALAHYTYPASHPLTKGHFPDRPVMMGVMQWMMIEDTILALALRWKEGGRSGQYRVIGQADLVKPDKTSVCEIKQFEAIVYVDVPGYFDQVELFKTEKISFRDAVAPGEKIYIQLTQLQILDA